MSTILLKGCQVEWGNNNRQLSGWQSGAHDAAIVLGAHHTYGSFGGIRLPAHFEEFTEARWPGWIQRRSFPCITFINPPIHPSTSKATNQPSDMTQHSLVIIFHNIGVDHAKWNLLRIPRWHSPPRKTLVTNSAILYCANGLCNVAISQRINE